MAFPTIPTVAAGRILGAVQADTTATRTFPNLSSLTKNSGDLLIAIVFAYQSSATANAVWSGWTGGFTEFGDFSTTTTVAIGCAYKWSTGSETGTFAVTEAASITGHAVMVVMSIPGGDGITIPEAGGYVSTAVDPGALDPTGWATEDTLWIAAAVAGETATGGSFTGMASAPTSYTDYFDTGISGDVVGGVDAAVAFRQNAVGSEDPGAFTADTSNARWGAITIAVRPSPNQSLTLDDTAAGADNLITTAATILNEAPTADEALSINLPQTLTDSATESETLTADAALALSDTATASDSLSVVPSGGAATSPALEISGFSFPGISSGDTINSVTVRLNLFTDANLGAYTYELWDGATAQIGTTQTGTASTDPTHIDSAVFTGVVYSQLANLRVRVYAHQGSATSGAVASVDYCLLSVDYTPTGAIDKFLSDSGAATDIVVLTVATTLSDSAVAADNLSVDQGVVSKTLSDSATAVDSLGANAALIVSESAIASDSLSTDQVATKTLSDSASESGTLTLAAALQLSDSGAATDGIFVSKTLFFTDTASALDSLSTDQLATKTLSDSASETEALKIAATALLNDSATEAENLVVNAAVVLADAASETEALTLDQQVQKTLSDTATTAESLGANAALVLNDTASATDSLSQGAVSVTLSDSGQQSDRLVIGVGPRDVAAASDSLMVLIAVPLSDLANAAEQTAIAALLMLADTAVGVDGLLPPAPLIHAIGSIKIEPGATTTSKAADGSSTKVELAAVGNVKVEVD